MRSLTTSSQGLFAAGMLAASLLGISSCGPDYAIFKVEISSSTSPRNNIEECRLTILDEKNVVVLDKYRLPSVYGPQVGGALTLAQGCEGGLTNAKIGTLSYSSSRTSGTLTFRVDAWDNKGDACGHIPDNPNVPGCKPVQTGSSAAITPKAYPPEIPVTITIQSQ